MRRFLVLSLIAVQPLHAESIQLSPLFGTELRYEQQAADRLVGDNDAIQFHARPGLLLSAGPWSLNAVSDAAIAVRRAPAASSVDAEANPETIQLSELRLDYSGLPRTQISLGRQYLGMAGASITGDRDGRQTFDAARLRWSGVPGVSADLAYAWSSSSLWAARDGLAPISVPGENIFARLNWTNPLGTLSGYAYQIDQRNTPDSQFRLLNQVYGARFSGTRRIGENIHLNYAMAFVRQTGSLANASGGAPTYWQIGNSFDLLDLAASQASYRRFAANGISTLNGNTLSLATSATRGRMTLGATYNSFRPVAPTLDPTNSMRVSLGLIF
ncbi:MAG: hypothetical protein EOP61_23755 [Sphingomonadales bacterium]|nr:MAG: hypothetical protein EOP61_23755 [Sphingomonadales bacterium]